MKRSFLAMPSKDGKTRSRLTTIFARDLRRQRMIPDGADFGLSMKTEKLRVGDAGPPSCCRPNRRTGARVFLKAAEPWRLQIGAVWQDALSGPGGPAGEDLLSLLQ